MFSPRPFDGPPNSECPVLTWRQSHFQQRFSEPELDYPSSVPLVTAPSSGHWIPLLLVDPRYPPSLPVGRCGG